MFKNQDNKNKLGIPNSKMQGMKFTQKKVKPKDLGNISLDLSKEEEIMRNTPGLMENSMIENITTMNSIFAQKQSERLMLNDFNKLNNLNINDSQNTINNSRNALNSLVGTDISNSNNNTENPLDMAVIIKDSSDELINIAKKELEILDRPEVKKYKNEFSLYIGVPFCKSTCLYCSFTSYDINKNKKNVPLYLDALEREFKNRKLEKSPMTIYIGGGTPTSLDDNDFEKFLCIIDENVNKKNTIEYTVEAGRPDTITENKLISMKNHGVSRISINPQTFNQKTLDLIGRKHTVEDIYEKYNLCFSKYIKNINMDLIIGLPEENISDVEYSINEALKISPTSITIHSLALKRAARLNLEKNIWFDKVKVNVDNQNKILEMFNLVQDKIESANLYTPYYMYRQKNIAGNLENIGYAKDGYESIYNIMMMSERHTVLAFGCGGVSKIVTRFSDGSYKVERDEGYKGLAEYLGLL